MDETTPLVGLPANQIRKKWRGVLVVIGGVLLHLTFGTVYTFGNMTPYLTSYLRVKGISNTTYGDSVWIYSSMLSGMGFAMYFGGLLEKRFGPRIATAIGCALLSSGVALTYFTIKVSFATTLVTYGLMFGFGKGIGYAVPLGCAIRWFPKRMGLVSGLVVAGIGGGSFIFDQIQTAYLNPADEKPLLQYTGDSDKYFSEMDILDRLPNCFLLLGGLYAILQIIGIILIANPPSFTYQELKVGVEDKGDNLPDITSINNTPAIRASPDNMLPVDFKPLEMVKTRVFFQMWLILLFMDHGIVFISALWKAYGQTFIHDDRFLAYVGAFSSVGNAAGRIIWGYIGDRFSFKLFGCKIKTIHSPAHFFAEILLQQQQGWPVITFVVVFFSIWRKVAMLCVCTLFSSLIATFQVTSYGGKPVFFAWVFLLFLAFSGTFSLLPSETAKRFGSRNYSMNLGVMVTAGTISGITGAVLTSQLQTLLGWDIMFITIAGIVLAGLLLTYTYSGKVDSPRPSERLIVNT